MAKAKNEPKLRPRRSEEQRIAELEARIAELKARAERKKAKKDPTLRHVSLALRSIDKALSATQDNATKRSLVETRTALSAVLSLGGVAASSGRGASAPRVRSGGSVDALKAEVRGNLELERKRRVFQSVRDQVFRGLRTQATLEIPKALVAAEAERMAQAAAEEMKSRGGKESDAQLSPSTFEPAATDRVAMGLIVGELVRANNLQATPEQVRALLNEQAQSYEKPEQVVAWYYQDQRRLSEFEAVALEQNVVDFVLAQFRRVIRNLWLGGAQIW